MKTYVDLNNSYSLKVLNKEIIPIAVIDIEKLNIIRVFKEKKLLLKIDFNNISQKKYKKILKNLLFIKTIISKLNIDIGIKDNSRVLLGYLINFDENNKKENDFILAINSIFFKTRYERYNYIYDTVCNYLDSYFYGKIYAILKIINVEKKEILHH